MMLTIKAAVFRYKIETVILVLPVATMIAFAQLHSSMPNAPEGFGKQSPTLPRTILSTLMKTPYSQGTNIGQSAFLRRPKEKLLADPCDE